MNKATKKPAITDGLLTIQTGLLSTANDFILICRFALDRSNF
jgi:hypothetical protein